MSVHIEISEAAAGYLLGRVRTLRKRDSDPLLSHIEVALSVGLEVARFRERVRGNPDIPPYPPIEPAPV